MQLRNSYSVAVIRDSGGDARRCHLGERLRGIDANIREQIKARVFPVRLKVMSLLFLPAFVGSAAAREKITEMACLTAAKAGGGVVYGLEYDLYHATVPIPGTIQSALLSLLVITLIIFFISRSFSLGVVIVTLPMAILQVVALSRAGHMLNMNFPFWNIGCVIDLFVSPIFAFNMLFFLLFIKAIINCLQQVFSRGGFRAINKERISYIYIMFSMAFYVLAFIFYEWVYFSGVMLARDFGISDGGGS